MTTRPAPCYANRELSWLQFNQRVLEEAQDLSNPLFERLNFLSIFQSNLDEFYMVRVGSLLDTLNMGVTDDKLGLTSRDQINAVLERTRELLGARDRLYASLMGELAGHGLSLCRLEELPDKTVTVLEKQFRSEILPLLSPQIVGPKQPFPFLHNKAIYAVAELKTKSGAGRMGIVPCAEGALRRLVNVPGESHRFLLLEDLIAGFLPQVFSHYKVDGVALVRLERSADIDLDESADNTDADQSDAYRKSMEKLIRRRKRLSPVKLEYNGKLSDSLRDSLCTCLGLSKKHFFQSAIPLELSFFGYLKDLIRERTDLFYPRRVPQNSPHVDPNLPMMDQIKARDIMLTYPYQSMRPMLRLLEEAGRDKSVVSIKMTLYRVARNSKIVEALVDAAENGKEVVVLVELRARFDEENNIGWSRVLERAGCRVIYGLDGLKVHSKLLLITRTHQGQVEYITQVGTGNYNEDTVRIYTDFALMTADPQIGAEAANVFNCLSMGETVEESHQLMVAPKCLRTKILDLIDQEIILAKTGQETYLGFKLNGLTDKRIIDKLIEASQAGVHVDLLVRGICCLIGGVPGYTDNIRVSSIVGRYLEHARIYMFGTPDRRRTYISSADFMTRNTTRRVEVAAPILDPALRAHVEDYFFTQLRDTAKLRLQQSDGTYKLMKADRDAFNSQEHFCDMAYAAAQAPDPTPAAPSGDPEPTHSVPSSDPEPTSETPVSTSETTLPPKRPGLFARLFGRWK